MAAVTMSRSPVPAVPPRLLRPLVRAVAAALGIGGLIATGPGWALSLGAPRLNSALGQPLDLQIPVLGDDAGELAAQCLRLLPSPDADTPTLGAGRVSIERDGAITRLRVQSWEPVNEPALRVVVEAGCQRRMQREYVLLLDPPAFRPAAPTLDQPSPALAGAPASAPGLDLGQADIRAIRGRPLQLRVPVIGPEAPRLPGDCVRTVSDGGSPPALGSARARLLNVGSASPVLEIVTREALADRSVRVIAEVGCERPLRREFDILVETPPISIEGEPAVAPAPAARTARRPQAERPAPARSAPTVPPVATARPPAALAPAGAASATPASPAAGAAPRGGDRLVLSPAEEAPVAATPANPTPAPTQGDELARQIAELATEVKRLRAELDAANARNAVLTEKLARGDNVNLGWAVAAGVSLLFAGLLWWSGRRDRPARGRRRDRDEMNFDAEGPMTRIVGKRTAAPGTPAVRQATAQPAVAGGTLMTAPLTDVRTDSSHIQVTEMGDEEAIRELYADFVSKQNTASPEMRAAMTGARPPQRPPMPEGSTRFGDDVPATRMTVPLTTQIAVDIDLSQDVPAPQASTQQALPTQPTQPMTRPLELDLELDLPDHAKPADKTNGTAGKRAG